jgi:hypothetical protein
MTDKAKTTTIVSVIVIMFGLGWFGGTMYTNQRWNAKIASAVPVVTHTPIPQPVQSVPGKPAVHNHPRPVLKPATVNVGTIPCPKDTVDGLVDENVLNTVKYDSTEVPGLRFLYLFFSEPPKLDSVRYQLLPRDSVTITRTVLREPSIGEYLEAGLIVGGVTYIVVKIAYYLATGKFCLP